MDAAFGRVLQSCRHAPPAEARQRLARRGSGLEVRVSTFLINHLRIPGGIPNEEGQSYLEQVESTVKPYGGKWLAQGDVRVVEGAWPGSVVLMEFPDMTAAQAWVQLGRVSANPASSRRQRDQRSDPG